MLNTQVNDMALTQDRAEYCGGESSNLQGGTSKGVVHDLVMIMHDPHIPRSTGVVLSSIARRFIIADKTALYPGSALFENFTMSMWLAWMDA
jgi:hypothetical protein